MLVDQQKPVERVNMRFHMNKFDLIRTRCRIAIDFAVPGLFAPLTLTLVKRMM